MKRGLFWAETRPSKFEKNLLSSFCAILLTNQQTDREMDVGGKITWQI